MRYPLRANVFLVLLVLSAAFTGYEILIYYGFRDRDIVNILVWSLLGVISESKAVYLKEGNIFASTTEAVFVLSFLISGPAVTLVVISAATLLWVSRKGNGLSYIFNIPIRYTLFNISHFICILGGVTLIYRILGGFNSVSIPLFPAIAVAPLFFVFSCMFNALFYKLEENTGFFTYLLSTFAQYLPGALMVSFSGIMVAFAFSRFGILSIQLFAMPVLLTRLTFSHISESS